MSLDPALVLLIHQRFRSSEFARWMGITLVDIGDGTSELRLDLAAHHLNPGNIVHGGVLATLLDACVGLALRTKLGMASDHVTVDLAVHYLAPARTGVLIGRGRAVRVGTRVSYGEAELSAEDCALVAKGSATFLVVPARRRAEPGGDVRAGDDAG